MNYPPLPPANGVRLRPFLLSGFLGLSLSLASLSAQESVPAVAPAKGGDGAGNDEVIKLGVFEVSSARDKGYSSSQSVGATRMGMALEEIPQNIAVINENLLRDVAPRSIADVAKYVGGVTETASPGRDIFVIRGVSISGPNTDGLPDVGSSQGAGLDMALFDRIEILKGPSAVIYGSTSSGGVVNRTMKKPQFDRFSGSIDLEAGSYSDYRSVLDINQPFGQSNQFAVRLIGTYWDRDGQQNFGFGRRRFIAPEFAWRLSDDTHASLVLTDFYDRYYKGWGQLFTLPPYAAAAQPYPLSFSLGLPHSEAFAEPYSVQWEEGRRANLELDHRFSDAWSIRFSGYTGTYGYYEDPTTILRDVVVKNGKYYMQRSWRNSENPSRSTTVALDSAWKFDLGPTKHKLVALAQYATGKNDTIQHLGRGPTGSTTDVLPLLDLANPVYGGQPATTFLSANTHGEGTSFGIAAQEQAYFFNEHLILQAAVRWNRNTSDGLNRLTGAVTNPKASTKWTPRYGAVYRFTDNVSVYYSRSETFTPVFTVNVDGSAFTPPHPSRTKSAPNSNSSKAKSPPCCHTMIGATAIRSSAIPIPSAPASATGPRCRATT
jgi:outer membrane receptor protein involved in Fe transport